MAKITYGAYCDIGDIKKTNQDSVLTVTDGKYEGLFIVADGCGGLAYGEEISRMITDEFMLLWNNERPEKFEDMQSLMRERLLEVNARAIDFGKEVANNVGSTIAALYIKKNRCCFFNVGDSRIYRIRDHRIRQLSTDQSVVADMVRRGEITKKEARTHRRKNVLTMCVGLFPELKIIEGQKSVRKGDRFIICSDGLFNCLTDRQLLKLTEKSMLPQAKVRLIRPQIPAGSARDNISAIFVEYGRFLPAWAVPAVSALLLAAGAALKIFLLKG